VKEGAFVGLDVLARLPDAQVLVVEELCLDDGREMFPSMAVVGVRGVPRASIASCFAGRAVILWVSSVDNPACEPILAMLGEYADSVGHITGDHLLAYTGNPSAGRAYARAHVRRYVPTPKPPEAPAARPAKPELGVVQPDGTVRAASVPEPEADLPDGFSQDALAAAFTARHSEWRYVAGWGQWFAWNGQRWAKDAVLTVFNLARLTCRDQAHLAQRAGASTGSLRAIQSASTIASVEKIARADPVHATSPDRWDADPWAINTPAGVVNLTTGALRPADPADHMTKITRAAPDKTPPTRWLQFLEDATAGDRELMGFLQRMAGYCLTGITREHALFFVHGPGGNGKGTFLNTLTWILDEYAQVASMDTFIETHNERHPTDIASLMGARLVSAQEVDEGRRWAEARITSLTGGDPITARFMRQDPFTFQPQFKLVIVGNNKPILRNVNDAIRRRLYLIPFTVKVPAEKRDPMLTEKLREEAGGILQWCIDGCLEWQRVGLNAPESVKAATEKYLAAQDRMANWLEEKCELDPLFSASIGELHKNFAAWCEDAGEAPISRRRFSDQLEQRGFSVNAGRLYTVPGIRLRKDDSGAEAPRGMFVDD
jgi:P4 family phage/plasmid primase-like protien